MKSITRPTGETNRAAEVSQQKILTVDIRMQLLRIVATAVLLLLIACVAESSSNNDAASSSYDCCYNLTCTDNSGCPCCQDQTCSDLTLCSPPITVACDPSLQKDVAPINFVVFQAAAGDSYSVGDIVPIMARFPDGVCLIDPATAGPLCTPTINIDLTIKEDGKSSPDFTVQASPSMQSVEDQWNIDFTSQQQFYDENGNFVLPWIFLLQVEGGMATTRLDVNWIHIPKECNHTGLTFNTSERIKFPNGILTPKVIIKRWHSKPSTSTGIRQWLLFSACMYRNHIPNHHRNTYTTDR